MMWTRFTWPTASSVAGSSEHGTETSCSIKDEEFFDKLRNYQIFNKGCSTTLD